MSISDWSSDVCSSDLLSSPLGRSTDFIPEYSIRQAKLPHCLDRAPKPAFDPRPARGPLVRIECRLVICEGVDNHARALVRGLAGERAMIAERRHRSLGLRIGVAQGRGAVKRSEERRVGEEGGS